MTDLTVDVTNLGGLGPPNQQLPSQIPQLPTQPPPVYATREDQQSHNQQQQLNQQQQQQWNAFGQKNPNQLNQMPTGQPGQPQNQMPGQTLNNMVNNNRLHNQLQTRHSDTDAMLADNDDECIAGNFGNLSGLGILNGNPLSANYNRMRQLQQWTQQSGSNMAAFRDTQPSSWRRLYTFLIIIIAIVIVGFIVLSPLFHYFM